jgi:hypothetical protein
VSRATPQHRPLSEHQRCQRPALQRTRLGSSFRLLRASPTRPTEAPPSLCSGCSAARLLPDQSAGSGLDPDLNLYWEMLDM